MKLYVDDWRMPPAGWALARTIEEAIEMLNKNAVEEISLDFVIGEDMQNNFSPVARHIVKLPKEKRPRRVQIHTSSGQGARTLEQILKGHVDEIIL